MTFSGNFWHWKCPCIARPVAQLQEEEEEESMDVVNNKKFQVSFFFLFNTAAEFQASASRKRGLTLYLLEWVEQVSLARQWEPSNSWPTSPYSKKIKLYIGHDEWSCFSMFYIDDFGRLFIWNSNVLRWRFPQFLQIIAEWILRETASYNE